MTVLTCMYNFELWKITAIFIFITLTRFLTLQSTINCFSVSQCNISDFQNDGLTTCFVRCLKFFVLCVFVGVVASPYNFFVSAVCCVEISQKKRKT